MKTIIIWCDNGRAVWDFIAVAEPVALRALELGIIQMNGDSGIIKKDRSIRDFEGIIVKYKKECWEQMCGDTKLNWEWIWEHSSLANIDSDVRWGIEQRVAAEVHRMVQKI